MSDPFKDLPKAKFYACDDPEVLTHDDPAAALDDYLERNFVGADSEDPIGYVRSMAPVEVAAYNERELDSDSWADTMVSDFFERAEELLHDNSYGDPDGDHEFFSAAVYGRYKPPLIAIIKSMLDETKVWSCEKVESVELDADELEAWVRDYEPHWAATATRDPNGPPARRVPIGDTGDTRLVCDICSETVQDEDRNHTWEQCAHNLRQRCVRGEPLEQT